MSPKTCYFLIILFSQVHSITSITSTATLEAALESECSLKDLHRSHTSKHSHTRPPNEQTLRLVKFKEEIKAVLQMRQDSEVTWNVDISFAADMSVEEEDLYRSGHNESTFEEGAVLQRRFNPTLTRSGATPAYSDIWYEMRYLRRVIQQRKGSCWAHTAAVPLESQLAMKKRRFVRLSVQEIFDCGLPKGEHQYGGSPLDGWEYVMAKDHLTSDIEAPEFGGDDVQGHDCTYYQFTSNMLEGTRLTSINRIPRASVVDDLEWTLWKISPVTVSVDSTYSGLKNYYGGLFRPSQCGSRPNHAMTMVGYGPEMWKVRNSWNPWGEDGYVRWARNGRHCFLLDYLRYPFLENETPVQKREVVDEEAD